MRFDSHTHTRCSADSQTPLEELVSAARAAGLDGLCVTDHCDLLDDRGTPLAAYDWTDSLTQYRQVAEGAAEGFRLHLGLELGCGQASPTLAEEIVSGAPLDFVLGSVHNFSPALGGRDFFFHTFRDEEDCRTALADYLDSLEALAPLPCYDALAHVNYLLRYVARDGFHAALDKERLRAVLAAAARTGHALEVNTNRGRDIDVWQEYIRLFLDCGGEAFTLGSDAHAAHDVGKGLTQAQELLRVCGVRYQAVYRRRVPQFYRL